MIRRAVVAGTLRAIGLGVSAAPVRAVGAQGRSARARGDSLQRGREARREASGRQEVRRGAEEVRGALADDDKLAEAHTNLAFSLRMQSAANRERALKHYDRALQLKPALAQAYMYRGVLFMQMGDPTRARADHPSCSSWTVP